MIIKDNAYPVRCPLCGEKFEVQFSRNIDKHSIGICCKRCKNEFVLYSNLIARNWTAFRSYIRQCIRILTNSRFYKYFGVIFNYIARYNRIVKSSKFYSIYIRFKTWFWVILGIVVLATIVIFWITEYSKGRMWLVFWF